MSQRTRTVRLDLAPQVYEALEAHAIERDVGVNDIVRYAVVMWIDDNPPPATPDADDV